MVDVDLSERFENSRDQQTPPHLFYRTKRTTSRLSFPATADELCVSLDSRTLLQTLALPRAPNSGNASDNLPDWTVFRGRGEGLKPSCGQRRGFPSETNREQYEKQYHTFP